MGKACAFAHRGGRWLALFLISLFFFHPLTRTFGEVEIISPGSEWKYLDARKYANDPNLFNTAYDDSWWPEGNAPFGTFQSGDFAANTSLRNVPVTAMLRKKFRLPYRVPVRAEVGGISCGQLRVILNGHLVTVLGRTTPPSRWQSIVSISQFDTLAGDNELFADIDTLCGDSGRVAFDMRLVVDAPWDILAKSVKLEADQVLFSYEITGADLPVTTTYSLFWSTGRTFDERVSPAAFIGIPIDGRKGFYTGSIRTADLTPAPANANYLLLVLDPPTDALRFGSVIESSESNNTAYTPIDCSKSVTADTILKLIKAWDKAGGLRSNPQFYDVANLQAIIDESAATGCMTESRTG